MSVFGVVGIVLIILKLLDLITWSWWWVTLPLWGGFIFTIVILSLGYVFHDFFRPNRRYKL